MPPPMGQPITVVEKPSSNPAILRFETNRPLSGMGHESYAAPPSELLGRPVDELARRLFAAGGVERVHINGSVITVTLGGGRTGTGLRDVVRDLFLHYPGQPSDGVHPPTDDADLEPMLVPDPADVPAAREADEPAAAEPRADDVGVAAHAVAVEDGSGDVPQPAEPATSPIEGIPAGQVRPDAAPPEREPTEGAVREEPTGPAAPGGRSEADSATAAQDVAERERPAPGPPSGAGAAAGPSTAEGRSDAERTAAEQAEDSTDPEG